jgi:choline monooxygenase
MAVQDFFVDDLSRDLSGVRLPLGQATGLPNKCYIDPEFHKLEAERLFERTWTCVGVGADIPNPGDAKPITLAGKPIVLARDKQGQIRALHNVCSHRGVHLVSEPCKKLPALRCPYHSWTYNLDGKLIRTPWAGGPHQDNCLGLDKSALSLKVARCDIWADFIFVNLSGDAPSLAEFLKPLTDRWAGYDFSALRHGASRTYELKANWKLALENFLESYHLPWVHPGLESISPLEKHGYEMIGNHAFGATTSEYRINELEENPLPPFPGLNPDLHNIGEYPMQFPNVMLGLQRDHFYGIIVDPVAHDRTVERLHVYFVNPTDEEYNQERLEAIDKLMIDWNETFLEDVDVVQRMQVGRESNAFSGGVLTPFYDQGTIKFMRLLADAMEA